MKKLLCLLLALVMVLSLAACSDSGSGSKRNRKDKDEEEEEEVVELEDGIVGTWTVEITMTEEMLQLEGANIDGIPVHLTFDEDGECTLTIGSDAADILMDGVMDIMLDMVYGELEAEGMSREEIDELFDTYYGMSVEEYAKAALEEADLDSLLEELEETTEYEVDGDTLTIDGYEMTAEIKGDKLTITEDKDGFWEDVCLEAPITLERD